MVTRRNTPTVGTNSHGEQQTHETTAKKDLSAPKISDYELSREERIKENRERLQKLGIFDLSVKLNSFSRTNPKRSYQRKNPQSQTPLTPPGPVRRSSRLHNSTPVSYCEVPVAKKEKSLNVDDFRREVGSKPEAYTDEHEKLLGSMEKSWTLFVDGYGNDGKRIYDPVRGKTCHQCRQKTLGHRTRCSTCSLVQGQFCGDCLYMRYGENVLEANENPNWVCPVCRGICNCSLCRQAKGWAPTGTLYRKISSLGYKSVAHYLIQTRRSDTNSDKDVGTPIPASAKRSLPFSDIEIRKVNNDLSKSSCGELLNNTDNPISQPEPEKKEELIITMEPLDDHLLFSESNGCSKDDEKENSPKPSKKRGRCYVSTPDSIGGRLRRRHSGAGSVNEKVNAGHGENSEKRADVDGGSVASRMKLRRRA